MLGTTDTQIKPNITLYARYTSADLGITGDAEATMPCLIQAIEKEVTPAGAALLRRAATS